MDLMLMIYDEINVDLRNQCYDVAINITAVIN